MEKNKIKKKTRGEDKAVPRNKLRRKRKIMPAYSATLTWHTAANREEWALRAVRKILHHERSGTSWRGRVFFSSIGIRSCLNSTLMCFSDVHAVGQQTRKLFTAPFRVVKLTVLLCSRASKGCESVQDTAGNLGRLLVLQAVSETLRWR